MMRSYRRFIVVIAPSPLMVEQFVEFTWLVHFLTQPMNLVFPGPGPSLSPLRTGNYKPSVFLE